MVAGHQPLTSDALAKLSSVHAVDTSKSVQRFVCSQMQHATFYAAEGIKTFEHCSRICNDVPDLNSRGDKNQLTTAGGGFSSPVLRPRNPCATEVQVELLNCHTGHARASTSKRKRNTGPEDACDGKSAKLKNLQTELSEDTRHQTVDQNYPPSKKKVCKPTAKTKKKDFADSDDEVKERLAQRRARRRQKKDIVDPRLDSETSLSCVDSDDKGVQQSRSRNKKNVVRKKAPKNKLPAGLALMHGFSAKNIAKHRLTVGTSTATGVFGKGKASDRSKVQRKKGCLSKESFNETLFLQKGPQIETKSPTKRRKAKESPRSSNSASVASTSGTSSIVYDFEKPPTPEKCSAVALGRKTSETVEKLTEESVIWDIEREFLSEPQQEMETGRGPESLVIETKTYGWAVLSPSDVGSPTSHTLSACGKASTVAPSHSVSQVMIRNLGADIPQPQASRYFSGQKTDAPAEDLAGLPTACKSAGRPASRESRNYEFSMDKEARTTVSSSVWHGSDTHPCDRLHQGRGNCGSVAEETEDHHLFIEQSLKSDLTQTDGITILYDTCVADDPNTYHDYIDYLQGSACDNASFHSHLNACDDSLENQNSPYSADELEPLVNYAHDDLEELYSERDANMDVVSTSWEQIEEECSNAYFCFPSAETDERLDLDYRLDIFNEEPVEDDNATADFNVIPTGARSSSHCSVCEGDDLLHEREDDVFTSDCDTSHHDGYPDPDSMTSTTNSSTPISLAEYAMYLAPFSQGRTLLLGIEDIPKARPQPPYETCHTTLENVETTVANEIRDHWRPMKL